MWKCTYKERVIHYLTSVEKTIWYSFLHTSVKIQTRIIFTINILINIYRFILHIHFMKLSLFFEKPS